jgi:hypothetical protein
MNWKGILNDWRIITGICTVGILLFILFLRNKALGVINSNSIFMNNEKLIFEEKVKAAYRAEFIAKIKAICIRLDIDPNWLMKVINKESAGTFSPSIKNPTSSATGLIQFMADTAKGLGTTTAKLAKMSAIDQLDYVEKYFQPYKGKMHSFADVYIAVFYPAALNKADSWVFPNWVYKAQKYIDLNKNGNITLGEFKKWMNK